MDLAVASPKGCRVRRLCGEGMSIGLDVRWLLSPGWKKGKGESETGVETGRVRAIVFLEDVYLERRRGVGG